MDKPETFIVTVRCSGKGIERDMEVPSRMPIGVLRGKILDVLKGIYPEQFAAWAECRPSSGIRLLRDDETLIQAGIFDGGYLDVIKP